MHASTNYFLGCTRIHVRCPQLSRAGTAASRNDSAFIHQEIVKLSLLVGLAIVAFFVTRAIAREQPGDDAARRG